MASGTPVACSNTTSMPEIAGECGLQFDPYSVEDMAEQIRRVWDDSTRFDVAAGAGMDRARTSQHRPFVLRFRISGRVCHEPDRKKLLVLTPRFPYPVIGGDKRIYHLCRVLSRHYSLTLLSLCESDEEMHAALPDDGVFDRVERVLLSRRRSTSTRCSRCHAHAAQVAYYRSRAFAAVAIAAVARRRSASRALRGVCPPVGQAAHPGNDRCDLAQLQPREARGLKSHVFGIEARRLLDYERTIVDDFDLSVLVSRTDRDPVSRRVRREGDGVLERR